jgi:quercetin dioxygenase-like cupin family protein
MSEPNSVSLYDLDWELVDERLKKKVLQGDELTITRYSFSPGGRFPYHVHAQEQVTYVLSGTITFAIEDVLHELKEGSVVIIPSNQPHSATAGQGGAEVLSFVTPRRSDTDGISILEGA